MGIDPREFGASLRETVIKAAEEAAVRAAHGQLEKFGPTMARSAEEAAQRAAEGAAARLAGDIAVDIRLQERLIDKVADELARIEGLLKGTEPSAARSIYEDVIDEQARLAKSREDLRNDLRAARRAEMELRAIAKDLGGVIEQVEAVFTLCTAEIAKLRGETEVTAERAAGRAVADLQRETLARISKACDFLPGDDDLQPRVFRGAYSDKTEYRRGDLATFLGSTFIKTRAGAERPTVSAEPDAPWQLFAAGGFGGGIAAPEPQGRRKASSKPKVIAKGQDAAMSGMAIHRAGHGRVEMHATITAKADTEAVLNAGSASHAIGRIAKGETAVVKLTATGEAEGGLWVESVACVAGTPRPPVLSYLEAAGDELHLALDHKAGVRLVATGSD